MEEDKVDMDELMRRVSFYAKITFFVNLVRIYMFISATQQPKTRYDNLHSLLKHQFQSNFTKIQIY